MLKKSKRVCFSPDVNEKPTMFLKHGRVIGGGGGGDGSDRVLGNKKRIIGTLTFRLNKDPSLSSPLKYLQKLGAKVESAIRVFSMRRRSSRKVSSSTFVRSRSLSDPTESHRAKDVEDCIEFLHSSSSRERPSSVSLSENMIMEVFN